VPGRRSRKPIAEFRVLGGFSALLDGRPVVLAARKDRALAAYLALSEGRPLARARLASLIWGDAVEDARHNLRQSLSNISRAFPGVFRITRQQVAMTDGSVDVRVLRSLLRKGSLPHLERASNFYAPLLEGLSSVAPGFDDWLTLERERLAAEVIAAHRTLHELCSAAGRPQRALSPLTRLASAEPYRDEPRRELMIIHAECGNIAVALAQYQAYAAYLRKELGAEPESSTREMERLLRQGELPRGTRQRTALPARSASDQRGAQVFLRASVFVLEQMPDCVVVTDLEGSIVGWNHWAKRNFGYDKREVLGRKPSFLYGPDADAAKTAELIGKAVRYGRWSGLLRLFSKDGSSRLQKRTMLPLRDDGGKIVGVFGVTRPLTRPIPGL
jgi:PAS domain S-box-containing protein